MPTVIELSRRHWLALTLAVLAAPAMAGRAPRLLAAWQTEPQDTADAARYQIGLLAAQGGALQVLHALDVPTRAHGLLAEAGGSVLAVARRPGDWMLRWTPGQAEPQTAWIEPDRAFNGHVIASRDGQRLYTTETDLETGAGWIGVRDAASLEKAAEWPTQGMDPHELLLDADGTLLVANGGVPTLPETGRLKIGLERMDASLVRLDTRSGALRGQWRLPDPRLSLRHIAWGGTPGRRLLGIALQAEHADAEVRQAAPVLALFDGQALRVAGAPQPLAGYGGDIAWANGAFAVSCPRANGFARYGADGAWQGFTPLAEACSLAGDGAGLWAGGLERALHTAAATSASSVHGLRLDNHWLALG
ncbi:DUF1513 domain-containing protein [Pseudorhodoferax sp. Leaf267]|uniref:DUF1513 domain-containing protein n=1 Tax=Pseudorhodoferax sp. Leaf267 TaxID=1736316 RepID=UPI0006F6163C|nr:DUF1513 domain-containing protein [Pseudorhodoferax sp. Leaf267]KQP23051.1 hypothetical protein ASF43_03970 [Pseudorhodoferax sp. Leaf267]